MTKRYAKSPTGFTLLVMPIEPAVLDAIFGVNSTMKDLVGAPAYYSSKHGYWPLPAIGWTVHCQE